MSRSRGRLGFFRGCRRFQPSETPTHPAQLPDARVGGLSEALSLYRRLAEEEKDFVVVGVFALGDPEGTDELWFWTQKVEKG